MMPMAANARRTGFTLVEMLVTVSIFSLALSALVAGLRSGAQTYQRVREHQMRAGNVEAALRAFAADVRSAARVSEAFPPLAETTEDARELLAMTTLERPQLQRAGIGAVWNHVTYQLESEADGPVASLVRLRQGLVSETVPLGEAEEQVLLAGVRSVAFSYWMSGEKLDTWDDPERLPQAVEIHARLANGTDVTKRAWIGAALAEGN